MTQRPSSYEAGQVPAWAMDSLLESATTRANETLYRGYLHEVNNALAGVGTLAESLKGGDYTADELDPSLDLIAQTTAKTAALEKKVRALLNHEANQIGDGVALDDFLEYNKNTLALMLPRSQRISFEFSQEASGVLLKQSTLWKIVSMAIYWARTMGGAEVMIRLVKAQTSAALAVELKGSLNSDEKTLESAHKIEDALAYFAKQHKIGFVNSQGALLFALGSHVVANSNQ